MKKAFLVTFLSITAFLLGVRIAEATFTPKVDICHCESNECHTLNIAIPAAIAHLTQHDDDYSGVCNQPEPSPSPSPSVRPSPSESPTPAPTVEPTPEPCEVYVDKEYGDNPCPSSTPDPTVEPSPTPTPCVGTGANGQPCGWSPSVERVEYHGPVCTSDVPAKPDLQFLSSENGCVNWRIVQDDSFDYATFNYGYSYDKLEFGIPRLEKDVRYFQTCGLNSGSHVWGQVCTARDNQCRSCSDIVDPEVR